MATLEELTRQRLRDEIRGIIGGIAMLAVVYAVLFPPEPLLLFVDGFARLTFGMILGGLVCTRIQGKPFPWRIE